MHRFLSYGLVFAAFTASLHIASAQTILLSETFDSLTEPAIPASWTATGTWETSTSSSSSGSGLLNLAHAGTGSGSVILPPLDFTFVTDAELRFLARRTSSYPVDSLSLSASIDGGATFSISILQPGESLPIETSSWIELVAQLPTEINGRQSVIFQFEAQGGSSSGSNIRLDDLEISATIDPDADLDILRTSLDFSVPLMVVEDGTSTETVPIDLSAAHSLDGFQFDLHLPDAETEVLSINSGPAITDTSDWSLRWNRVGNDVRVLVLNRRSDALAPGEYSPVMTIDLAFPAIASGPDSEILLSMSGILGAFQEQSVPADTLFSDIDQLTLRTMAEMPDLQVDTSAIDLGFAPVGSSATFDLSLTNSGSGPTPLVVNIEVSSGSNLFAVSDAELTIPAGASVITTISYIPTLENFGTHDATLTIVHDGASNSPATVHVSATGTSGRGDANQDGFVDTGDLLLGMDHVLGLLLPPDSEPALLDVFPGMTGDGAVDVRDLTILVSSILDAAWPDGVELPPVFESAPLSSTHETNPAKYSQEEYREGARISVIEDNMNEYSIWLHVDEPMRGIELALSNIAWFAPVHGSLPSARIEFQVHPDEDKVTFLATHQSGSSLPPGSWQVGRVQSATGGTPELDYAFGFSTDLERLLVIGPAEPVNVDPYPIPLDPQGSISVFPNPWTSSGTIPLTVDFPEFTSRIGGTIALVDVTGRQILHSIIEAGSRRWTWPLQRRHLPSGTYFVHYRDHVSSHTFPLVVLN